MDKMKQWVALAAVAVVAVGAGGWFLLVSPKREQAAELQTQTDAQAQANAVLETQLKVLKGQARDLPKEQAKLALVATKLPPARQTPALIRSLTKAADGTGVDLVTMTPGEPEIVAAAPGSAAPASTVGSLARIPVTLQAFGSYFEIERFAAALEDLPRALRVTNLSLAPGESPLGGLASGATPNPAAASASTPTGTLAASITAEVYMIVDSTVAATPAASPVS